MSQRSDVILKAANGWILTGYQDCLRLTQMLGGREVEALLA